MSDKLLDAANAIFKTWQDGKNNTHAQYRALQKAIKLHDRSSLEYCDECGWNARMHDGPCLMCLYVAGDKR